MYIIFESITKWSYFFARILKFFNLKIFYLDLICSKNFEKERLYKKLKNLNVIPLPIVEQKNIPYKIFYESSFDKDEVLFKKNNFLISEKILGRFCQLFSIDKSRNIELRLFSQDHLFSKTSHLSTKIKIWSKLNQEKKIIFISFNFWNFYFIDKIPNVQKIILPFNFLNFINQTLIIFFQKILKKKINDKNYKKNENLGKLLDKKEIALVTHKGLAAAGNLYEKNLYYSENKDSPFNINNILHLDYDNFYKPKNEILWVNLKKLSFSKKKVFFKLFSAFCNTFYYVTSWRNFLAWYLLMHQYFSYITYLERLGKFKNLKLALIDYDHLCPKGLIFAFRKKKIKIVATQERFLGGFFRSFYNVIADTYFTCSDYMNERIRSSKYFQVKTLIPVGQYRSDYLTLYENKDVPKEILLQRKMGKKIVVGLGIGLKEGLSYFDSNMGLTINWKAQKSFLDDMIRLSQDIKNVFLILRFRNFLWKSIPYFQDSLKKISETENISIADNYSEFFNSYKYCANTDLIIANYTSLADECLAFGKPLIFYDYTHNLKKIISGAPGYIPTRLKEGKNSDIFCHDYKEILDKSKFMLSNNFSQQKQENKKCIDQIYYLKNKGIVKNKILNYLEKDF